MTWSSTLMIRGISMVSPLSGGSRVRARGRPAVADEPARARAAVVVAVADLLAVHPDLVQAVAAGDEPVGARGQVVHPLHPLHPDGGWLEGDQVGEVPGGDTP